MSNSDSTTDNNKRSPALFAGLKYSDLLVKMIEATILASNRKDYKTWCELLMNYYSNTSAFMGDKTVIAQELIAVLRTLATWQGPPNPTLSLNMYIRMFELHTKIVEQTIDCLMKSGANESGEMDLTMLSRGG